MVESVHVEEVHMGGAFGIDTGRVTRAGSTTFPVVVVGGATQSTA